MRPTDIKFRAKRKDNTPKNGQWVYGDLTHTIKITKQDDVPCVRVGGCDIDESTIGQFLGIKDVNDKEIYTGDIIEAVYKFESAIKCTGYVYYDSGLLSMMCKLINFDEGELEYRDYIPMCVLDDKKTKVVGNIYDNPDMLTKEIKEAML